MTNREMIARLRKVVRLVEGGHRIAALRQLRELIDDVDLADDDEPERVTKATWAQALDQGAALDHMTRVERGVCGAALTLMSGDGVLSCSGADLAAHANVATASATTARRALASKGWLVELPSDEDTDGRLRVFAATVPPRYSLPEETETDRSA